MEKSEGVQELDGARGGPEGGATLEGHIPYPLSALTGYYTPGKIRLHPHIGRKLGDGFTMPTMDFTLALALVPFISAGAGAYFGSYLRKKGENVATHEDIGLLVDQVRAVTETAKGIEAKISDEVWNRQRQWELKRDAVYSVIQAIGLTDDAVVELVNGLKVQKRSDHPERFDTVVTDRWLKSYESVEDLERKRAMALIVCGVKLTDVVLALKNDLRKILGELGEGKLDAYQERGEALQKNMAKAFACARDELNISDSKHQSGGSSAALKG